MTILEDENIILMDNSIIIINKIKKWIARNVRDIIKTPFNSSLNIKPTHPGDRIFENFNIKQIETWLDIDRISYIEEQEEYQKNKFEYLINLDNNIFSSFIQLNLNTQPIQVIIDGDLIMTNKCESIPANLFQIIKINGNLDFSFCKLETTDGFPDRKNINGCIYWYKTNIYNNKYKRL